MSRVTPRQLEKALLHWDELDDGALVTLASHPASARRLAGLRAAEAWLHRGAPQPHLGAPASGVPPLNAGSDCPGAGELYDLGRGPGCTALDEFREQELRGHVAACPECALLVASLAVPPPLPIEAPSTACGPGDSLAPPPSGVPARPLRPSRTWRPFALAAALAGLALLPQFLGSRGPGLDDLPRSPLLRGGESAAMLFPRERLLALPEAGALAGHPRFELQPEPRAAGYRVELFRHAGGAFEAGDRLQVLRSAEPQLEGDPLAPGHYTWRAWAEIDGLERSLGALDFEVVADAALAERVQRVDAAGAPRLRDLIALISELHEAGFRSDARRQARRLPACAERDEYLHPPRR